MTTLDPTGAERELHFLPLFGELALLLPHTRLHIVFFGLEVQRACRQAPEGRTPFNYRTYLVTW